MKKSPFSISPSPSFLYITPSLDTCLHKVRYVIDNRQGLTAILGDVGVGKSTVMRYLFAEYQANEVEVVTNLITNPRYKAEYAFLKGVCECFDVPNKRSTSEQEKALRGFLIDQYKAQKLVVLFIDEAQNLSNSMLETLRGMLNFETEEEKLIQIVLAGQVELKQRLLQTGNKAIRRRIVFPSTLDPLSFDETIQMIAFRCERARVENPFPETAVKAIYESSNGVPGDILRICAACYDLMLLSKQKIVTPELVAIAEREAILVDDQMTEAAHG